MSHVCFAAEDGPVADLADLLDQLVAAHLARRLAAVQSAVDATSATDAATALLEAFARWTPDALAEQLRLAFQVALLTGRQEVLDELGSTAPFSVEAVGQSFREQLAFLQQKQPAPTKVWTDLMRGQHDRAFMVAGANDAALVGDFFDAVQAAAATWDKDAFAAEFDRIVEKHGWSYNGGRSWRIRTIYETNLRTSYMAGRLAQMRDPDVVRMRPFWQYRHGENGEPKVPRPQHVAWDRLVLRHDDPWWDIHYPPNDWMCSCGVRTLSQRDLEALGKSGPDDAPAVLTRPIVDKQTGKVIDQPAGVGYGWDYMPGDHWTRGLVPSVLIGEGEPRAGRSVVAIDTPSPLEQLVSDARSLIAPPAPPSGQAGAGSGLDDDAYSAVMQFLGAFGVEDIDGETLFQDVAGHRLAISADLFRDRAGQSKIDKRGRLDFVPWFAQAVTDPDEIWLQVRKDTSGQTAVARTYIRAAEVDGTMQGLVVGFELAGKWWSPSTAYPAGTRKGPEIGALKTRRSGKLVWKRN